MTSTRRWTALTRRTALAATLALLAGCGAHPTGATWNAISDEERNLLSAGLLGDDYPQLAAAAATGGTEAAVKLARKGFTGPFATDFGDPAAQLKAARFASSHSEYARFLLTVRRGDLVFISQNNANGFVSKVTGGPYSHVILCTDAVAPGQFIEAVGVTGNQGDAVLDRVRRTTGVGLADERLSLRILRPQDASSAARERAVEFATAQLGKPYNYSFSDSLGGDRAFYCSSLAYRAYQAADIHLTPKKDAARDRVVEALTAPVLALQPDDAVTLADTVMRTMHRSPALTSSQLAQLLVNTVLPACKRTRGLIGSDAEKSHVIRALVALLSGKPFGRYSADALSYRAASAQAHVAAGSALRQAGLEAKMVVDFSHDTADLLGVLDLNTFAAARAVGVVLGELAPYADVLSAYLTGPTSPETRVAADLLDAVDSARPLLPYWPRADVGPRALPGHAPFQVDTDFVSPTDLAWADVPHLDFNTTEPRLVQDAWPFAVVPETGRFFGRNGF